MSIETMEQFEGMRAAGAVVAETLRRVGAELRAGVTTGELDAVAGATFAAAGAHSGPALDFGYPAHICISINDEAVHGLPGPRVVRPGDMVAIDVTAALDGYYADAAITLLVEPATPLAVRLKQCAEAAFRKAAAVARHGTPLWRVGHTVETEVRRRGFRVLRDLCGHGIGRAVHESPRIPNFRDRAARGVLHENLVIALEPIVSVSASRTRTLADGWTLISSDRSLTAHHEHTLVIRRGEPYILTAA